MVIIYLLITIALFLIASLIFTNEGWNTFQNQPYNNYASLTPDIKNTMYYERPEYRLPYRYPVGFHYDSPTPHTSSVHAYDIN